MNRSNPHKNFLRRNAAGVTDLGNNFYFAFDFLRGHPGLVAGYSPLTRSISISEELDTTNMVDMMVLKHELKHAALDANKRGNIQSREQWEHYRSFYTGRRGDRPRVDLAEELFAYGFEIEDMNLFLNDALRKGSVPNMSTIRMTLNARKDQEPIINLILKLAKKWYPQRIANNAEFPQKFTNEVAWALEDFGQELYTMNPHTLVTSRDHSARR